MPLVYKALAFGGPNRGQFEVQSKGFQMLEPQPGCPTGIPSVVPDAARIAAEKNMVGAVILWVNYNVNAYV